MRDVPARAQLRATLFLVLLVALVIASTGPVAAATEADQIISIAKNQVGDVYRYGTTGPSTFDCSGLVYFTFKQAGLLRRIGGQYRSAQGFWDWFRARGMTRKWGGRRGDLVIWGRGKHVGIYIGNGKAISALLSGVKVHGLNSLNIPFTTFLLVRLER